MRRWLLTAGGFIGFGLGSAPPAQAIDLTMVMRTHHLSALEAAAVVVAADALHVNADFIISTGRGSGVSPLIYAPAVIVARRCREPFPVIWKERHEGWGQIAHRIGMHPGTFNKLRKQGYSVDQIIWMDSLNRRYRIPYSDYGTWRSRGMNDGRILELVARNDGNRSRIQNQFRGGGTNGKAHGGGKKGGHGGPPGQMKKHGGKGHGKGHGNSGGKGGGNGHGNGHGGGGGNGKGHGNGGGKGHGKGHGSGHGHGK